MPAVTPTTGKWGSKSVVYLVDGFNMLAAKVQDLRHKIINVTEETHGLGDNWKQHSPVGLREAQLVQEGAFFNTAAGNSHDALKAPATEPNDVNRIAVVAFAGNAIGQPMTGFEGVVQTEYEPLGAPGKLQRANAACLVTGKAEDGVILHALGAETADSNTEASSADNTKAPQRVIPITSSNAGTDAITTSVPHGLTTGETVLISGHAGSTPNINGEKPVTVVDDFRFTIGVDITVGGTGGTLVRGKTVNGGSAYLEVTDHQLGTFTDALITTRHSADDAVFADLVAFAAETLTRHAQRVTVAGVVNRYLAVSLDRRGAGSGGSITYLAGFARS